MNTENNQAVARRYFEELWNRRDLAAAAEILDPQVVGHAAGATLRGLDALRARVEALYQIYAEPHFTIEDQFAEGDRVMIRWTLTGRHTGEFMGSAPSGREVTVTGMNVFRLAGGRIVEVWVNGDDLGELQQLGVLPAAAGA